jgi:hypothetical protein
MPKEIGESQGRIKTFYDPPVNNELRRKIFLLNGK